MGRHKLAMLLFISSEAIFFGSLIITYLMHRTGPGSLATQLFDLLLTGLFSLALFSSSATMELAGRRFHRGDRRGLRVWLLATAVLGFIFLAGQGYEYRELLLRNINLSTGIFGSSFFTLTGFHGLHVLVGLTAILILWSVGKSQAFLERGGPAVESVALYWHFVDSVWVVIFSLVYLWTIVDLG